MSHRSIPGKVLLALLAIQFFFGVNYVFSKFIVMAISPSVWAAMRIVLTSFVLLAVTILARQPHPPRERSFFVPLFGWSLLALFFNQLGYLWGLRLTTPTNSSILNSLIPVFVLLLALLKGQERFSLRLGLGFLLAFGGALMIRRLEEMSFSSATFVGDALTIFGAFSYACFLVVSKKFFEKYNRAWATVWMFFYGSLTLSLASIPAWGDFNWPVFSWPLLGCISFSVICGTAATYFLNAWTLSKVRSSEVALFIYLQPPIAAALSWALRGETLSLRTVISGGLIFAGLLVALSDRQPHGPLPKVIAGP